jgi:hypothetical protein
MRYIALIVLISLAGCLNVPKSVTLPDGSQGYTVTRCRHLDKCLAKAHELCAGAYEIKSQSESFSNGFTIMVSCKAK